jgi:putative ABC transport system permease protein
MSRLAVALRLARRDIARAPGRTLLTVAMVALPVTAVTAADVLLRSVDRPAPTVAADRLGPQAEAVVRELPGRPVGVSQDPAGESFSYGGDGTREPLTSDQVLGVLPDGSRLATVERGLAEIRLPDGPGRARAELADPADPLLAHRYSVTRGRLPARPGEIAVAPKLVMAGLEVGERTVDGAGRPLTVTGVLPSADRLAPALLALPRTLPLEPDEFAEPRVLFVDSPAPVTWEDVQELNELGTVVTSRAVLRNPPADAAVESGGVDGRFTAATFGLVAAMAVLEIVLLAGPAFAVGARRSRRALAQLTAAGGEGRDARRVVLAGAGLLGVLAAATGIGLGLGVAVLARSTVQALDRSAAFFVPPLDLAIIFIAAVGSALLAALAPARAAGRAHPVAVLTERPDPPRPSRLPVVLAIVLLTVGVLASLDAARSGDEVSVALSAVPTVLGAVLLAPLALVLAGRAATRLPFAFRYAVRDAARQRARTAPAVGAIAAVVAGAVALGVGASSDAAQSRATDGRAGAEPGISLVSAPPLDPALWQRISTAVQDAAPTSQVIEVQGVRDDEQVQLCPEGAGDCTLLYGYGGSYGTTLLVGAGSLDALGGLIPAADRTAAEAVLRAGGAVALANREVDTQELVVRAGVRSMTAPAVVVEVPPDVAPVRAVLSEELAQSLQLEVRTTAVTIGGPVDDAMRRAVADAVDLRAPEATLQVQGVGAGDSGRTTDLALLLLGSIAAVLVLGGVLTSTLLALSDARPQFATLHAVGAGSGTRRLVAAGYAATLGLVGALLGVAAGLVPGVAVTYPLTRSGDGTSTGLLPQYLDVPWLLLAALVVVVPTLAAVVAALTGRGPLPTRPRTAMA